MNAQVPERQLAFLRSINVNELSAGALELIRRAFDQNHNWTRSDQSGLNMVLANCISRRDETVLERVDALGTPLCRTIAFRLTVFVDSMEAPYQVAFANAMARRENGEVVALPERRIVRLDDDVWGRGVIAIPAQSASYVSVLSAFLLIPDLTPADIRKSMSHKTKFKKFMTRHYNHVTKERLEVTWSDEYAIIFSHSDLAEGRNPRNLASSGNACYRCKYMSEMSDSEIDAVHEYYR